MRNFKLFPQKSCPDELLFNMLNVVKNVAEYKSFRNRLLPLKDFFLKLRDFDDGDEETKLKIKKCAAEIYDYYLINSNKRAIEEITETSSHEKPKIQRRNITSS